ncbi:hypothetical protein PILCRDRAFT_93223 [Piloderma croceum F 1598]|uniref:Uncharacterized protein n=1 Tax=Piloderma croceum (strain F 1598) TaxID=765440 RepID=A0A0C3EK94_PILCF|nr:hypothetical protein PILCRDRAFT_93223 [Piloderma croceum F 1598]
MPRPSKRAKASEQTAQSSLPRETFTDLPSELLLDIVSRIPTMSIVDDLFSNPGYLPLAYRERSASLRALSQTCKTLRKLCLPLAWETLEACTTTGSRNMFFKEVGESLERKCNGLMQSEYLFPYVRIVTVSLTRYKTSTILPAFASCLAVLPNLHTIQVVHANTQMTTAIKTAFEGHTLPSVRTVAVPSCAHEILRRCPGVEHVTCNKHVDDESRLIGALASAKCGNLKTLRGISPNKAQAKRIGGIAPNLTLIQVVADRYNCFSDNGPGFIADFADSFKNLSTIEIRFEPESITERVECLKVQCVRDARWILGSRKCDGEKLIRLRYTRWEGPDDEFKVVTEYKLEEIVVV